MSSLFTQPAVKEKLKARIAIDGPTGSGKTWTGLQCARLLAGPNGKVGVVDTENRSAAYYAPSPAQLAGSEPIERINWWDAPYEFAHEAWQPPYDPRALANMMRAAGEQGALGPDDVLLVDSLTHFWTGEGGTLDIVDNAAQRQNGNKFTAWSEGTPAQRMLLDTIIHAPYHVVTTMRSKMEYVQEEVGGRKTVRKIGMAPEQRAGIEYEFTVVADMDLEHRMVISKSRCSLIADVVAPQGRSAEVFQRFAGWLHTGVERVTDAQLQTLADLFRQLPDGPVRQEVRGLMQARYGRSTEMPMEQFAEAHEWLQTQVAAVLAPTEAGAA